MAVGKTTAGKKLTKAIDYDFVDLDALIEKEEQLSVADLFETKGEAYFRKKENEVLQKTAQLANTVIACGGGTPCFSDNMEFINNNGMSIWLKAPIHFIIERLITSKTKRPLVEGLSTEEMSLFITEHYSQREPFYEQSKYRFDFENKKLKDFIIFVQSIIYTDLHA